MARTVDTIEIGDRLSVVKSLLEILFMAATDIDEKSQRNAIQAVCDIADDKIEEIEAILDAARGEQS